MAIAKALFETPSVQSAVISLCSGVEAAAENEIPDLVFGWSARADLAAKPEFAFLLIERARYLRLPAAAAVLAKSIEDAVENRIEEEAQLALRTAAGRWRTTLRSLTRCADRDLKVRVYELARYANEYWPGWYDDVSMDFLELSRTDGGVSVSTIEKLAAMHMKDAPRFALQPLFPWMGTGHGAQLLDAARDAAEYVRQEALAWDDVLTAAMSEPWWLELSAACGRVRRGIAGMDASALARLVDDVDGGARSIAAIAKDGATGAAVRLAAEVARIGERLSEIGRTLPRIGSHKGTQR